MHKSIEIFGSPSEASLYRIGRKPVIICGLLGMTVSVLAFGLSKTFWALVISRALSGVLNGNMLASWPWSSSEHVTDLHSSRRGVCKSVIGEVNSSALLIWQLAETYFRSPIVQIERKASPSCRVCGKLHLVLLSPSTSLIFACSGMLAV